MNFSPGNVARIAYKWPHQAKRDDGHKDRAAVVFQAGDGHYFMSPMSTVPPDAETSPFAIPVSTRLQRQLGLSTDKPSWIYANHANMVEMPSPAVQPVRKADGQTGWTHGNITPGMLDTMRQKREEALAAGKMKIQHIERDSTIDKYRSSTQTRRLTPGVRSNNEDRVSDIREKAAARAARAAQTRPTLSLGKKKVAGSER